MRERERGRASSRMRRGERANNVIPFGSNAAVNFTPREEKTQRVVHPEKRRLSEYVEVCLSLQG